ncbi:MAG: hypothetical protein QNJ45_19155 [Ardenticatenaceae bacterium]|nr:hypothetical protein [Ardenticatenaceae bacterium]
MRRIAIRYPRQISPFNEPARDLRIQNKPLWLLQRDLWAKYVDTDLEFDDWETAGRFMDGQDGEIVVHRDNLFFNQALVDEFIAKARQTNRPVQLAFRADDPAIQAHVRPLTTLLVEKGELVLAEMWYLPDGWTDLQTTEPLVVDMEARERGYYHIPPYTASVFGDLVYQLPKRSFVVVESWIHVFVADILFGIFAYGVNIEDEVNNSWTKKLKILMKSMWEQKPFLSNSEMVVIGKNANIHPTAQITGPAIIGDNVSIDAGVVIDACIIGNNVTISQGASLHISVIGDGCFLPFRAATFMTTLMEDTMVAQNTCLQLCVVGRQTFIGAGTTFTDTSLLIAPIKALNGREELEEIPLRVIGGCVGHHCHLGSGLIIYPSRVIESDTIVIPTDERSFIKKNVRYEDSDHLRYPDKFDHPRLYPRETFEEDEEIPTLTYEASVS